MNERLMDPRTAVLAAVTAVTVCDAEGYADALTDLPPFEGQSAGSKDIDADKALFTGSGVAS